jgi:hypothetical protein
MNTSDLIALKKVITKQLEDEAYSKSLEVDRPLAEPSPTSETSMKDIPFGGFF